MNRRDFLKLTGATLASPAALAGASQPSGKGPNILFAVSDDQSFAHAGAMGDTMVQTPAFDRVAREGALFTHAFCSSPSCTPSRGALLTGRNFWQLEEGGNLWSALPAKFPTYPELLAAAGYYTGHTGKAWGPGRLQEGGRSQQPPGPGFKNFDVFMDKKPKDQPFCFWFGCVDPHRPYERGSGAASGKDSDDVQVPPFLPNVPEIRSDIADYYFEVERFDKAVDKMLDRLERDGLAEDTIVIITSDNGMPFPRAKANLYDYGTRMPFCMRWPGVIAPGQTIDALVNHIDVAPTLLEAAGLPPNPSIAGESLLPLAVKGGKQDRTRVFFGRERHAWVRPDGLGYPCRAVRTRDYLYIRNFEPDRWPPGDPPHYGDVDIMNRFSPTKHYMLDHREDADVAPLFQLAFGKRPAEELYDLGKDPHQLENVAAAAGYEDIRERLSEQLMAHLKGTGDPRALGKGDVFDQYPYYGGTPLFPPSHPAP